MPQAPPTQHVAPPPVDDKQPPRVKHDVSGVNQRRATAGQYTQPGQRTNLITVPIQVSTR